MATKTKEPKEATTVEIAPRPESVVQTLQSRSLSLVTECKALVVTSVDGAKLAADLLERVANAIIVATDRRFEITRPLDAAKKSVMALFTGPMQQLEEADRHVRKALLEFETARRREEDRIRREAEVARQKALREEEERAEAARKALAQGVAPEVVEESLPPPVVVPVVPVAAPVLVRSESAAGVTYVTVAKFEITDAALLPREFLVANESAIRAAVKAGRKDIPGVRTWDEQEVRRV